MKTIVILSGGLDSTTTLYHHIRRDDEVKAISFNYGQRQVKELDMARRTCKKLGIEHKVVDISNLNELLQGSALTSDIAVPHGNYDEDIMKITVVPNRNMILASISVGYAVSIGYDQVALGVHAGDHAIYPDCRPEFIDALTKICAIANYKPIKISAPFLNKTKAEIVAEGTKLGVDYGLTWTCYEGQEKACGKCGSCRERLEAFSINGLEDPLQYKE